METDLVADGWEVVRKAEDALTSDGDSLAIWIKGDKVDDFLRLLLLLGGERMRETVCRFMDRIFYASVYVKAGTRRADVFLTFDDGRKGGEEVYSKRGLFVSPEVLEMIEKAAIGE